MHRNNLVDGSRLMRLVLAALIETGAVASYNQAQAHTTCANNAVQLRTALASAGDGGVYSNEDNTIYIAGGTHHASGNPFFYSSTALHTLSIIGTGSQQCAVIKQDASTTILDGDNLSRVFETHSSRGAVMFQYLTIQNGNAANKTGGGLSMNAVDGENGQSLVNLVIIRDNHAGVAGGFYIRGSGPYGIDFLNNLVIRNSADTDFGGGDIDNASSSSTGTRVNSNTFAQNTVINSPATGIGGLALISETSDTMSNNILWDNSGYDLYSDTVRLVDNDYDVDLATPAAGSSGNHHVGPQFVGPTNFRLSAQSTLLKIGTLHPPGGYITGVDIDAKPRTVNNKIDLGAYERQ